MYHRSPADASLLQQQDSGAAMTRGACQSWRIMQHPLLSSVVKHDEACTQPVCHNDPMFASTTCRLAELMRKWPFDPQPIRTASADKHARSSSFDKLLGSGAAVSDSALAEIEPAPADLAPDALPTASAPPAAPAAAPAAHSLQSAAAAAAVDERHADSTDAVQRPQKRVRRTPTGACRFW